eukprot:GHVQ01012375.1.p2 GENE.GHVQ01012375.1~~GHVQ01012375.1.p2  ORF type:complete len:475 (-),score=56.11 GHVQ01012375.1:3517-4941(-)
MGLHCYSSGWSLGFFSGVGCGVLAACLYMTFLGSWSRVKSARRPTPESGGSDRPTGKDSQTRVHTIQNLAQQKLELALSGVNLENNENAPNDRNEDAELLEEQFVRNIQFFGSSQQQHISQAFAVVVGIGGVGSHCAVGLARSGLSKMRLIDFDRVTLSSLNRHATALRSDVGCSKVECVKSFILGFLPAAEVEAVDCLFESSKASELLRLPIGHSGGFFVVDCVDNIDSKVELIAYCIEHSIPIISSCGAGMKADPTKIQIHDIADSREDELARVVRSRLRQRGIRGGVPVCYSTERSSRKLLPLHDFQKNDVQQYRTLDNFRIRIVPVIGPLPAIFGQAMAAYVLTHLADQPFCIPSDRKPQTASLPIDQIRRSNYRKLFETLKQQPRYVLGDIKKGSLELPYRVTCMVYCDIFEGKSLISGKGTSFAGMQLVPWELDADSILSSLRPANMVRNNRTLQDECVSLLAGVHDL